MAICSNCGKRGLFLFVNSRGLCEKCAQLVKENAKNSSQITISPSPMMDVSAIGHKTEEDACNFLIDELVKLGKDREKFHIEHPTQDYTSLFYSLSDIVRIKITTKVCWISILLSQDDKNAYADSPLFKDHLNKNELHWKSYFQNFEDLKNYVSLVNNSPASEVYGSDRTLSGNKKTILQFFHDAFVECGASLDEYYIYLTADEVELTYHNQNASVRFKAYKRKKGGYIIDGRFKEYGIKTEDNKLPFADLMELESLKKKYIPKKISNAESDTYAYDMAHYFKYEEVISK